MAKRFWFKNKLFGWGWYPATWEGWVCMLGYIALMMLTAFFGESMGVDDRQSWVVMLPIFTFLTGLLIYICYRTGEKPRWRWGK